MRITWPSEWRSLAMMFVSAAALAGCRAGNFANENDALRARVMDLESQIDQLTRQNAELQAKVRIAPEGATTIPEDIRLNTPQVAELTIDKLSFVRDADKNGQAETLTLYLKPTDGMGRFVQIVGTINLAAVIVPLHGEPINIAQASFGPAEVRQAYRSGFSGTHYTLETRIAVPSEVTQDTCIVKIEFQDGLTGRTMTAERTIPLK